MVPQRSSQGKLGQVRDCRLAARERRRAQGRGMAADVVSVSPESGRLQENSRLETSLKTPDKKFGASPARSGGGLPTVYQAAIAVSREGAKTEPDLSI